ncbi:hypothetical protein CDAR_110371 [Caerostris darwini]|uniref:Uncharacterized protein n=1 Tax=Caerostris darwini TaxID=1538125 RepID=A0AAV4M4Z9_9ARAC|nr:hypothetical protein CDAR_110371 [Caerostris darwini]
MCKKKQNEMRSRAMLFRKGKLSAPKLAGWKLRPLEKSVTAADLLISAVTIQCSHEYLKHLLFNNLSQVFSIPLTELKIKINSLGTQVALRNKSQS